MKINTREYKIGIDYEKSIIEALRQFRFEGDELLVSHECYTKHLENGNFIRIRRNIDKIKELEIRVKIEKNILLESSWDLINDFWLFVTENASHEDLKDITQEILASTDNLVRKEGNACFRFEKSADHQVLLISYDRK
jgi:hypothetical protein